MDGELIEPHRPQPEIITPETFFPSEPLNYAFRLFLWHYCRRIGGVNVVFNRGRPQLEVEIRFANNIREVTVTMYSDATGVTIKATTAVGDRNCPGVMHLLRLFMEEPDNLRYRVELDGNFTARLYTETSTFSLRTSGEFYDLIIRLAETAARLEKMEL